MLNRAKAFTLSFFLAMLANVAFAEDQATAGGLRAEATVIEAVVLSVDYETREASLELPFGLVVSLVAGPEVRRLNEIKVGDRILATYLASLAGELREPTEEEKAQPFVVMQDEVTTDADQLPGRAGGVMIRAVCTIEGMNRVTGRAMIKDSRGSLHVIEGVPAARFDGVTLGSTVIMTYTQAVAIALEKRGEIAE